MQNQNQNTAGSIEDLLKEHKKDLTKKSANVISADPKPQAPTTPIQSTKQQPTDDLATDLPDPADIASQVTTKIKPKEEEKTDTVKKDEIPASSRVSPNSYSAPTEQPEKREISTANSEEKEVSPVNSDTEVAEAALGEVNIESLKKLDEAEIRRKMEQLEAELAERASNTETAPEQKVELATEQSVEKNLVSEPGLDDALRGKDLQPTTTASLPSDMKVDALEKLPKEEQVKVLTNIVYKEGLYKAINIAIKLGDPYVMDLLHDTLVNELFAKLKASKKI